ncbi:MAG TPA: cysteine--tRNA ligase, partial [Gemmatimonadales bacterium]|nr:cysteine--tRNA ligase [Gemmatimonadales bacterium]
MSLQLFNTLSRRVESFEPITPGRVSFYTCGPTVYNFAHIGNFRTFLFQDLLRRWLEASGYEVLHIMNLTDVDDKTIRGAAAAGLPIRQYVQQYIEAFHEDRAYLRLRDATAYPRATEYIGPMIALVESLLEKGVAYRGEDGSVYFAIARFPAYGRLSRLDTRELLAGASERVSADEYAKEDARDFVLWKAARPEDEEVGAAWDAPFGRGRPGWHLECSAMALDLLAGAWGEEVLDIHAGGVDLIFPHHEDEIAQSCAHTGRDLFARYWLHGEFMTMGGTKMSKRFGNFLTARDLREEGVDPGTVRLLVFTTHYRQSLDWSDEALAHAREGSRRLGEAAERVRAAAREGGTEDSALVHAAGEFRTAFAEALDDDLNGPRALA